MKYVVEYQDSTEKKIDCANDEEALNAFRAKHLAAEREAEPLPTAVYYTAYGKNIYLTL